MLTKGWPPSKQKWFSNPRMSQKLAALIFLLARLSKDISITCSMGMILAWTPLFRQRWLPTCNIPLVAHGADFFAKYFCAIFISTPTVASIQALLLILVLLHNTTYALVQATLKWISSMVAVGQNHPKVPCLTSVDQFWSKVCGVIFEIFKKITPS